MDMNLLWTLYWVLLVIANIAAFVMFRYDKGQAQRPSARRVPEATLLLLLALGGVVGGGIAMFMRPRHKTRKPAFWAVLILASVAHAYLVVQALL
jgi:uncharacterized membrane protein YsdA (DUF1294 family)